MNIQLLRKVRETITRHPEIHDQGNWGFKTACGTTHCIAGWAAVLDGAVIDWEGGGGGSWAAETVNGGASEIADYAREALDLSEQQARIFYQCRADALAQLDDLIDLGESY